MQTTSSTCLKLGVLGSGSGSNMQSVLDAIAAGNLNAEVRLVLSDVPDARILERARSHRILCDWLNCAPFKTKLDGAAEQRCIDMLKARGIDTVVLAGFMRIVKPGLLKAFPLRVLNIHPALLPAFPGLHAWQQALEYGAKVAGCTVHFVTDQLDHGPIIAQAGLAVRSGETADSLAARVLALEHQLYPRVVQWLAQGRVMIQPGGLVVVDGVHDRHLWSSL